MSQATTPTDDFLINGRNTDICVNMLGTDFEQFH